MAAGPVFPGFIKVEYKTDGSAKAKFLADAAQLSGEVKKPFSEAFDSIGKMVDRVSGKFTNGNFKLDLDVSSLREASAQADFTVKKMQALRDAALSVATANKDQSESTRAFVTALQAQASAAESASIAARDQLTAYGNLQGAVVGLTRDNQALAQSYRDTYLEQATVANAAYKAQQQFNGLSAPGLDSSRAASRNGAPSSASNSAFIDQAYAPKVDPRTGLEAFLAGKGAVDSAVMSVTTLEQVLGRVAKKGPEVAAALAEVERAAASAAAERVAAEQQQAAASDKIKADAAAEMQRLAQSADSLRAELDPAVAAQNRFNAALDRADDLLKAGVIDQRTYGQAVSKAQNDLQTSWRSLTVVQEEQQRVAKRGTSVDQNVINSMRSVRVAGIQAGQQLQDMAIQFQMGTNASTIMAQQLPQLGFALSGLEGNANKTLNKIGTFATFLAGPWGAAILIAGVVMAPLIEKILGFGDAADDAKGKSYDFSNGLNGLAISANEAAGAFAQLAQEIRGAIAVQGDFLQSKAIAAGQASRDYKALYDREREELQALKKRAGDMNPFNNLSPGEIFRMNALSSNQPKLSAAVTNARDAEFNATIALRQQAGLEKADPQLAINNRYRRDMGALEKRLERSRKSNDPLAASTVPGFISDDQYQAEVTRLALKKASDLDALKPAKKGPKGADPAKEAERAAKAAMRLGEFSEDAGKKIANIADSFRDIPPEVERVNKASRELDDIISDLMNRKPEGFKELVDQAQGLKDALPDMAFGRVMRQITEDAQQQVAVQSLLLQGREGEANALRQIYQIEQKLGPLRADQKQDIIDTSVAMQRINEQLQRAQEIQQVFLESTRSVRNEVEAILGGYGKLSDLGSTLKRSFQQIQGKILTEKIFGDMFRDMDKWVKEKTGIGSSVDKMAKETERAGDAASTLADELLSAAQRISGAGTSATSAASFGSAAISGGWGNIGVPPMLKAPANENYDPNAEIVVTATKSNARSVNDLTPEEYFRRFSQSFGGKFANILEPLLGKKFAGNLGGVIGGVFEGQATTGTGFGAILGGLKELKGLPEGLSKGLGKAFSGAQTGATVAGIGNALGLKLSNTGAQIGGAIGKFIPIPGGDIIGAIAGGFIGKLISGTKKGYAVAKNGTISTGGNSKQAEAAGSSAGALNDSLSSIAKAFGSSLGDYAVSIGSRSSGWVSVSGAGSSMVGDKGWKKSNAGGDLLYDGKDMEEALRVALKNAIEDGAIQGIRAGSKRLLSIGANIDAQVEKALKFENVFKTLKAIKDPVGAALDELNTEFKGLIDIFKEAGASSQEYADLEELYGIKRKEAVEQANQGVLASIKGLLNELKIGSEYFSLRDRKASALEVYNPLKARVAAGDTTAFDAFSDAARNLISIEREISGSTSPFFALLKEVTDLSNGALAATNAKVDTAAASDSPFSTLAAQNAATTSAIDNQTQALLGALGALNDNTIAVFKQLVANGASSADVSASLAGRGYF